MADYTSFKAVFSKISGAVDASKIQASRKAANSTRAKLAKDIKADIGLASAKTKARVKIYKADTSGVVLSIATKQWFAAHEFNPKKVKLMSAKGPRVGASYQLAGQSAILVPGAFLVTGRSSGKLVMVQRASGARYPTQTVTVNVFEPAVLAIKPDLDTHMVDTFDTYFRSQLTYNMSK